MTIGVKTAALAGSSWQQYAVRFALGGLVTVVAGGLAHAFGPVVGGLFLAFPAIFPAGATLIAQREREKKARQGLNGAVRGRRAAALDASGTVLGAVGLMGFAVFTWLALVPLGAAITLCAAVSAWLVISVALWWLHKKGM